MASKKDPTRTREYKDLVEEALAALDGRASSERFTATPVAFRPKAKFGRAVGSDRLTLTHLPKFGVMVRDRATGNMLGVVVQWMCEFTTRHPDLMAVPQTSICRRCFVAAFGDGEGNRIIGDAGAEVPDV